MTMINGKFRLGVILAMYIEARDNGTLKNLDIPLLTEAQFPEYLGRWNAAWSQIITAFKEDDPAESTCGIDAAHRIFWNWSKAERKLVKDSRQERTKRNPPADVISVLQAPLLKNNNTYKEDFFLMTEDLFYDSLMPSKPPTVALVCTWPRNCNYSRSMDNKKRSR
eukprot:GHVU01235300.1.p1 GENE.GHVU01235300.1~~GHVU01235300.1.p1  ORF type:complete len:166 (+),score=16.64 GHVU01235300.1:148-645(+)